MHHSDLGCIYYTVLLDSTVVIPGAANNLAIDNQHAIATTYRLTKPML